MRSKVSGLGLRSWVSGSGSQVLGLSLAPVVDEQVGAVVQPHVGLVVQATQGASPH